MGVVMPCSRASSKTCMPVFLGIIRSMRAMSTPALRWAAASAPSTAMTTLKPFFPKNAPSKERIPSSSSAINKRVPGDMSPSFRVKSTLANLPHGRDALVGHRRVVVRRADTLVGGSWRMAPPASSPTPSASLFSQVMQRSSSGRSSSKNRGAQVALTSSANRRRAGHVRARRARTRPVAPTCTPYAHRPVG